MPEAANGRFTFKVVFRNVGDDRGLAIHVYGPVASAENEVATEEVLRFDCFEQQPHYHLAWSYRNDPFVRIDAQDPFEWALSKLRGDMAGLLSGAGALPMNVDEAAALHTTLSSIEKQGRAIAEAVGTG